MKKAITQIGNFFYNPVRSEPLGCFRIAIALFALIQLVVLLPDWMWFYGPNGILTWEISDVLSTKDIPAISAFAKALSHLGMSDNATVYTLTATYFLSLSGLIAGYKTRLTAALSFVMHLVLNTTGHFTAYGVETFTQISLFYCMVLPVGVCWSVDSYKKPFNIPPYLITLSVRLIQLHLCIMYVSSGLEKAMGSQWWDGEAIWIAMQQDQFHQISIDWMAQIPVVPKLLCWGTLMIESLYPIGMLWSKTRKVWLVAIMSMHFFIGVFLGLHLFGALMMLLNLTAFGYHCFPGIFNLKANIKRFTSLYVFRLDKIYGTN